MALTALEIANHALVKLGARTIETLLDNTTEAQTVSLFLHSVTKALLSAHPWSFATTQTNLTVKADDPLADFQNAFDLPSDFLRIISAGVSGRGQGLNYRIHQKKIHTDVESCTVTYIAQPAFEDFPPFFDQALITRLAAEICIPLTENTSRTDSLFKMANDEFKRAKSIDAQQETPVGLSDFALIDARS